MNYIKELKELNNLKEETIKNGVNYDNLITLIKQTGRIPAECHCNFKIIRTY